MNTTSPTTAERIVDIASMFLLPDGARIMRCSEKISGEFELIIGFSNTERIAIDIDGDWSAPIGERSIVTNFDLKFERYQSLDAARNTAELLTVACVICDCLADTL
jgi:hypothetical protein